MKKIKDFFRCVVKFVVHKIATVALRVTSRMISRHKQAQCKMEECGWDSDGEAGFDDPCMQYRTSASAYVYEPKTKI